jgi:acetyl coenzyme A synthetase (ADP forming)-like protein
MSNPRAAFRGGRDVKSKLTYDRRLSATVRMKGWVYQRCTVSIFISFSHVALHGLALENLTNYLFLLLSLINAPLRLLPVQPSAINADVVLKDGSIVQVKALNENGRELLHDFVNSLSVETLSGRFFSAGVEREVALTSLLPKEGDVALVGIRNGKVIAHASYHRTSDKRAEVALVVSDEYQEKGLGTILLGEIVQLAAVNGILLLDAVVQPQNYRMINMLRSLGYQVSLKADPGSIKVTFATSTVHELEAIFDTLEGTASTAAVRSFLFPRSVAVVGASRDRGTIGGELFWNILESGFRGVVYPVNNSADYVQSVRAYRSVLDCPGDVDIAIICVPSKYVLDVAKDCAQKGVKGVVVISAGFSESGPAGTRLQQELVSLCNSAGMRIIGPNCMGIINTNPEVCLNAQFSPFKPKPGRMGFLSQSGALGIAVIEHATRLGLGLSSFVSVGNKADISGNDLIQYWEQDEDTDVILLYLESFGNPRKFARIAKRVTKKKPIIAVKGGRSVAGFRATQSHTGAILAASDITVDALFRQTGVIRVDALSELFDLAALLGSQPLPRGKRVGIITNAGGAGILASDACESYGLEVPELSPSTQQELRTFLRAEAGVRNPVDMVASASPEDYSRAIRSVSKDPQIDSLFIIFIPPLAVSASQVAKVIIEEARRIKMEGQNGNGKDLTILSVFMATHGISELLSDGEVKIPSYPFPESAARALSRAYQYSQWVSKREGRRVTFPDIKREEAASIVSIALSRQGSEEVLQQPGSSNTIGQQKTGVWLTLEETLHLLSCYGIRMVDGILVKNVDEVERAAKELGGNVVLKAVSKSLLHKTEVGAVKLNLTPEAATEAAKKMFDSLAKRGIEPEGFLIQRMLSGGFEMLVGVTHDQSFGPVIACGSGGVFVELMKDVSVRLAPLTDDDAEELLTSLKSYPVLKGFRGGPKYDVDALKDIILRVSCLVEDLPQISEMDLNPVMLLESGGFVVDARIKVAESRPPFPLGAKRVTDPIL